MSATSIFAALVVSHLVGDFIVQTDGQAKLKRGGLTSRGPHATALFSHLGSYGLSFVPALLWLASWLDPLALVGIAAGVLIPHLVQDDGGLLGWWMRAVKGASEDDHDLWVFVDQSFHILALYALALVVAG
ncbi:MAG: DUF3307 domain-containing protein [Thermoleophilaceae bacterium]|nr:DUF3307 domain-containing protein [Thermoleophilaceae bacterium]